MVVVADTTPIINFYFIGELNLLEKIYQKIVIPDAVLKELVEHKKFRITMEEIKKTSFIEIQF